MMAFEVSLSDVSIMVGILVAFAGMAATVWKYLQRREEQIREEAAREANEAAELDDLAEAAAWFRGPSPDDPDRQSLPQMVIGVVQTLDRMAGENAERHGRLEARVDTLTGSLGSLDRRLNEHLNTEERDVREINDRLERLEARDV